MSADASSSPDAPAATAASPAPHARPPWTVRVAVWSARHRWPVLVLWFVATIGVFVLSASTGGTRTQGAVSQNQRAKFEAARAYDLFGTTGQVGPVGQSVYLVVSSTTQKVTDPPYQAAVADFVTRFKALTADVDGAQTPVFQSVTDPLTTPPGAGLISQDLTSVRVVGFAEGEGIAITDKLQPVPGFVAQLRQQYPQLEIHALSNTLANEEISELVNRDLDGSLRLTIPITFLILLIAFGALVAAFVPLVLAISALLAAFGLLGIYSQVVDPVSPYASQLVVLIGLAVAVDYSLFMVSRARREWRQGRDRIAGIATASSTAGRAVFFSGLAVMISIAGLFLLDDPLFRSMAIATIGVVLVSVVGSLTFLPAVLAILGTRIDRGRVPYFGRPKAEGSGFWARIVGVVMRRPVVAALAAAVFMLALASPVTRIHLGQGDLSAIPDTLDAVQAINLMNAKWPTGTTLTVDVVVTHANEAPTKDALAKLDDAMLAIPGVSAPIQRNPNQDGTVIAVTYTLGGGQNDIRNQDIVRQVRHDVVPALFGPLKANGVQALVSGDAAYTLDVVNFYLGGMPSVFLFVLGLSFLLLLVAFRSVVIPIKAIILNLLSTGAAYGVMVLVFQENWFGSVLAVKPGPIEAFVPVIIFTILFGLSMDYHVFILTRIKEARDRGLSSDQAVARGISITSGTITSAAAIMVAVFAVFVTLQLYVIKQIGLGLAVAVLLDATVIRTVLLPATMRLLGDWNWWLPGFLRWLPHVTIEGEEELAPEMPQTDRRGSAGEPAPA
jgi:RND superfamily putative drug exporter